MQEIWSEAPRKVCSGTVTSFTQLLCCKYFPEFLHPHSHVCARLVDQNVVVYGHRKQKLLLKPPEYVMCKSMGTSMAPESWILCVSPCFLASASNYWTTKASIFPNKKFHFTLPFLLEDSRLASHCRQQVSTFPRFPSLPNPSTPPLFFRSSVLPF